MFFVSMVVQLRAKEDYAPLSCADGAHAHAAILTAITRCDARCGQSLHDARRDKGFTLAIVESSSSLAKLRLTFMLREGVAYDDALVNSFAESAALRIGTKHYEVVQVDLHDPVWSTICTWDDLKMEQPARFMDFEFVTPTAISKKSDEGRFTHILPEARDVFMGLARRWAALNGPHLPHDLEGFIQSGGCVICEHTIRSETFVAPDRTQKGFVGHVGYECLGKNRDKVLALNALARFAYFSGVGYQTARGMGAVRTYLDGKAAK